MIVRKKSEQNTISIHGRFGRCKRYEGIHGRARWVAEIEGEVSTRGQTTEKKVGRRGRMGRTRRGLLSQALSHCMSPLALDADKAQDDIGGDSQAVRRYMQERGI